jgi:hypothetical protein
VNAAEVFLKEKSKTAAQRAEHDLHLWHAWNTGGRTPDLLEPLMSRYDPLMRRKSTEWRAPNVAPAAFKAELEKQFIQATQTFDPNRGVAFNTHVQSRLKKAQRFNSRHQNIGYIPEDLARHVGPMDRATNDLTEDLGRPPTAVELASHMGISQSKVKALITQRRKDVPSSHFESDPTALSGGREADVVRLIQRRPSEYLTPDEVRVFSHVYGINGARKILDTTTLAMQLGLSQPKVSRLKTSIAGKVQKYL